MVINSFLIIAIIFAKLPASCSEALLANRQGKPRIQNLRQGHEDISDYPPWAF